MVRLKGGECEPCHIGEEMPAKKGDIWRGGLALRGESGREILVRNSKLRTVDRPVESLPSGRCPVISGSGKPGGMVGVKVAKHHLVSTVLQKSAKVRGDVYRAGGRGGGGYVNIDEGQSGSPEDGLDCQNFRRVIIGEDASVRHPIGDGVVDEGDKSPTAIPRSGDRA